MKQDLLGQQMGALREYTHLLSGRLDHSLREVSSVPSADAPLLETLITELSSSLEELRVAEEELRAQGADLATAQGVIETERRRYQELFDLAPDAYLVTDPKGVVLEANRAAGTLLRNPRLYLIGKPVGAFVAEQDFSTFTAKLKDLRTAKADRVLEWEVRLRERRGVAVAAEVRVAPVRDRDGNVTSLRWLMRDITERRRTEEEIRRLNADLERRIRERTAQLESVVHVNAAALAHEQAARAEVEGRYAFLFEHGAEGIVQINAHGAVRVANPALTRMLGYASPVDLIAAVSDVRRLFVDPRQRRQARRQLQALGALNDFEARLRQQQGGEIRVRINARARLDAAGRIATVDAFVLDITDQRRPGQREAPVIAICNRDAVLTNILRVALEAEGLSTATMLLTDGTDAAQTMRAFVERYDPRVIVYDVGPEPEARSLFERVRLAEAAHDRRFVVTTDRASAATAPAGADGSDIAQVPVHHREDVIAAVRRALAPAETEDTLPSVYLTAEAAARRLGVTDAVLRQLVDAGTLHATPLPSGRLRFTADEVTRVLRGGMHDRA